MCVCVNKNPLNNPYPVMTNFWRNIRCYSTVQSRTVPSENCQETFKIEWIIPDQTCPGWEYNRLPPGLEKLKTTILICINQVEPASTFTRNGWDKDLRTSLRGQCQNGSWWHFLGTLMYFFMFFDVTTEKGKVASWQPRVILVSGSWYWLTIFQSFTLQV